MADKPAHNDVPNPNEKDAQQALDASDTVADQTKLVPNENLRAPVKPNRPEKPSIPKKDERIAEQAKRENLKDNEEQ